MFGLLYVELGEREEQEDKKERMCYRDSTTGKIEGDLPAPEGHGAIVLRMFKHSRKKRPVQTYVEST